MNYIKSGFQRGMKYGFKTKIKVPEQTDTSSINRFTIEFGYHSLARQFRYAAATFPAPLVRKLLNAEIGYKTSRNATLNEITFSLQTVTDIPRGGGIVISGPGGFFFDPVCLPVAVIAAKVKGQEAAAEGDTDLPFDATCTSIVDGTYETPTVSITAGPMGIAAKLYKFHLSVTNPRSVSDKDISSASDVWTFRSFELVSDT